MFTELVSLVFQKHLINSLGRTGRAGQKGIAYTLLTEADIEFAGPLMKILENAGQDVPVGLVNMAKRSKWYAENATKNKDNFSTRTHTGLGYVEKKKQHVTNDPAALLAKPSTSRPQVANVSKAIEKAKNVAESSTGVMGLSRYETMRKALKVIMNL
jgi:superfamily II DNA/RNA helicase